MEVKQNKWILAMIVLGTACLLSCKPKEKIQPQQKKEIVTQKKKKKAHVHKNHVNDGYDEMERIMGVSRTEIRKNKLYSFVAEWYGVPYKYGGCKKAGVDCSCFTSLLYEQVYNKKLSGTAAELYKHSEKLIPERAKEGDLVFFKINVSYVSHVGVMLRNGFFVHASTSKGVMVSSLTEPYFKKYFHSTGRIKEL